MSAQHTPGPWITHPWSGGSDDPRWRVIQRGSSGGAPGLAVVHPRWNAQGATVEANARLIAAAPEMLALLLRLQESAAYWGDYAVPLGIVDDINKVIEKATAGSA